MAHWRARVRSCPKCHSLSLRVSEWWRDSQIVLEQSPERGWEVLGHGDVGEPYKVTVECQECGHRWRMRGRSALPDDLAELRDEAV